MKTVDLIRHLAFLRENRVPVVKEIARLCESLDLLDHEIAMYQELLATWPERSRDGDLEYEDLPDTEPGTPKTKSSTSMKAVRPEEDGK